MRAREFWTPDHLEVYGVLPWQMDRFTVGELETLDHRLKALAKAARKAERG